MYIIFKAWNVFTKSSTRRRRRRRRRRQYIVAVSRGFFTTVSPVSSRRRSLFFLVPVVCVVVFLSSALLVFFFFFFFFFSSFFFSRFHRIGMHLYFKRESARVSSSSRSRGLCFVGVSLAHFFVRAIPLFLKVVRTKEEKRFRSRASGEAFDYSINNICMCLIHIVYNTCGKLTKYNSIVYILSSLSLSLSMENAISSRRHSLSRARAQHFLIPSLSSRQNRKFNLAPSSSR